MGSICGGTIWVKWPKTAEKLQNQSFLRKTVGRHGGEKLIFWVMGINLFLYCGTLI